MEMTKRATQSNLMEGSRMSTINGAMKQITKLVLLLMMGVSMSACSAEKSWKEEVLLHDGQKIIVERHFNLGGGLNIERRERKELDETVTFKLPGSDKTIAWKTEFDDFAPEANNNDLSILLLDIVNGVPYIATSPAGCIGFNKWKRPNPPYIFFKFNGKDWKRITLEEFPAELNKANVILSSPSTELLKSFYTVEQVNAQNNDGIRAEGSRTIIRKPFAIEENRCPELVPIKGGGWGSPGGIKRMIPIEQPQPSGEKSKN